MKTKTEKNPRLGFSLIEVIFAFVITFTFILGTTETLLVSLSSKRLADQRMKMINLLSSKLANLRSEQFKISSLPEGAHLEQIQDPLHGEIYQIYWDAQRDASDLWAIEMACRPKEEPNREIHLYLYISDNLGF